jgi:hypothetical protein
MIAAFTIQASTKSVAIRFLLRATAICGASIPAALGAQGEKPVVMDQLVVNAAKTHTLFMGADISVNLDKDLYPVRGVIGSSWVIDINGDEKVVSTKQAPMNLKITPTLKLTDVSATIAGYKKERAYSFNNDPGVRLTRGLSDSAMTYAFLIGNANDAQYVADTESNKALGDAAMFATSDNEMGAAGMLASAQSSQMNLHVTLAQFAANAAANVAFAQATAQGTASANLSQTDNGDEPGGRLFKTGLDAMDVEFEISSNRPLQKPYVVTVTRFHPKGTKPGTVQNLVYAMELHQIDAHPTNVHFVEGGFPYDFELVDFQLHIYNGGEEVATTVSSERVELTRGEAFEYARIEYIGAHKGATLPALPAMGILPADLPGRLAQGEYKETIFVRVSKDGFAGEPFADELCSKRIEDPYLDTVVRCIRFDPALALGKPVEGVASVNLRQLKI